MFVYLNKRTGDQVTLSERNRRLDGMPNIWQCDDSENAWQRDQAIVCDPEMVMLRVSIADYDELASIAIAVERRIAELSKDPTVFIPPWTDAPLPPQQSDEEAAALVHRVAAERAAGATTTTRKRRSKT